MVPPPGVSVNPEWIYNSSRGPHGFSWLTYYHKLHASIREISTAARCGLLSFFYTPRT